MKRQYVIFVVIAVVMLMLVGMGVLAYGLSRGGTLPGLGEEPVPTPKPEIAFDIPQVEITPPAALAEIANDIRPDYPELADLLENPELGSVYKDFYLAYRHGGTETALALARQRGILNNRDEIIMTLVLDTEDSAPLIAELEAEGIIVQANFRHKVNIAIPVSLIQAQIESEAPDLIVDRISNLEHVIRLELPHKATVKQGAVLGQGVAVTLARQWQANDITGRGVKVGVLDLGFGGYRDLLGEELPAEVTVEKFGDDYAFETEIHGTACAEIIHEMAPEADLYLAYYDGSDVALGLAVEWLISQQVDIISNSTGNNGLTPMDGTGFAAELVEWAYDEGILWINAAGNEADVHYRGRFTDSDDDTFHEFSPDIEELPFIPFGPGVETQIILSWDDWETVSQDYDLSLFDSNGNLLGKSENAQTGEAGQRPVETLFYEFEDEEIYLLVIENYEGRADGDATFDIFVNGGLLHPDFITPEFSLCNPADARGALAIGAVSWADDALEPYSSQGPTADGRLKPDLSAPSVVNSASYAPELFDGTSAAAPHVSGAAALIRQAFPDFGPDQISAFLKERAIDLGPAGADTAFGVGRLYLGDVPAEFSGPGKQMPDSPSTPEVGLPPGQVNIGGEVNYPPPADPDEDDSLALIMSLGLCLICLGGLLLVALLIVGLVMMRRR